MRVLLIEDNDGDADLVREALSSDVEIARVDRIATAAQRLDVERFDVVLLDLSLPDAVGLEGLHRLRAAAPSAPIVVLTGNTDRAAGSRALAQGAQDYLQKGEVEGSQLLRAIRYARERGEYAERARLLADVGIAVASTLDATLMLAALEKTLSESYADWCGVDGASVSADAPPSSNIPRAPAPRAQLFTNFNDVASDDPHRTSVDDLRARGFSSAIIVPFRVQGWPNGALTCGRRPSSPPFEPGDRALCEEITRRVMGALEHAELLAIAQRERHRAEIASQSRDEFLATLSHELRTPLNAILGWTQLLRSGAVPVEKQARALETIERNTRSQVALIEDVLDVSRIITGKLRVNVSLVDLRDSLRAAHDSVRLAAEAKGIHIEIDPGAEPIEFESDPDRLLQVLWNLLSNAVKFTPRGGRVTAVIERVEGFVEIRISDDGQGIDAAFLPHVFERFRQADSTVTRTHGGLGLGLAITRHLVEIQGGTIRVESDGAHRGATFIVRLPVSSRLTDSAVQVTPVAVPRPRAADPGESRGSLAGLSILVVDDDPDAQMLVEAILSRSGAAVTKASSAAEAMSAIAVHALDVVVSDIGMPGESGHELVVRIRELGATRQKRLAVIALTAYARPQDRTKALLLGFDGYLTKPFDADELVAVIVSVARRMSS